MKEAPDTKEEFDKSTEPIWDLLEPCLKLNFGEQCPAELLLSWSRQQWLT